MKLIHCFLCGTPFDLAHGRCPQCGMPHDPNGDFEELKSGTVKIEITDNEELFADFEEGFSCDKKERKKEMRECENCNHLGAVADCVCLDCDPETMNLWMPKASEDRVFATGARRDNADGKGRFDLLPWYGIWEVAKLCEEGAKHYGERNVDKGIPAHCLLDSAARHLARLIAGETGEDHARAAAWNLLWYLNQRTTHPELDDMPKGEAK